MGVMYSEKRDFPRAISAFENALRANPRFAHAHLGLAAALSDSGELRRAFEVLEHLFATSRVEDTRALPTFEHASRTYREFAQRLAGVFVRCTQPATLRHREFLAAHYRALFASRRSKLGVVIVPSPRVLTARLHPRYFPL